MSIETRVAHAWHDTSRTPAERVDALIAEMTLEEKLAQLFGIWVGASSDGGEVAPQVAKPARHSSCASAGMPNRLDATIRSWVRCSESAPRAGSTGAVPNGRVS